MTSVSSVEWSTDPSADTVCEFVIGNIPPGVQCIYVGAYVLGGPSFDVNESSVFNSSFTNWYSSNGEIFGFGDGSPTANDAFVTGDVIGCVASSSGLSFYKNGVLQRQVGLIHTAGVFMAGVGPFYVG